MALSTSSINDDEKPEITNPPQDVTLNTSTDECGAIVSWDAVQTTDNCEILSVTSTRNSGEFFDKGTTSVTIIATDTSNNQIVTYIHSNSYRCPGSNHEWAEWPDRCSK